MEPVLEFQKIILSHQTNLSNYLYIMWSIVRFQVAQNYTDALPSIMLSGCQQKNVLQIHESHAHLKAVEDLVSNLVVAKQK